MYEESQIAFSMISIIFDYQVAQWSRICLPMQAMQGCKFNSCVWEIPCSRKWQPSPVFLPENSMNRGAWQAAFHGIPKSWMRLSMCGCMIILETFSLKKLLLLNLLSHGLESKSKPETFILTGCVWSSYKFGKISVQSLPNLIRFCLYETQSIWEPEKHKTGTDSWEAFVATTLHVKYIS